MMENNKHDLGLGLVVEIVETIPDENGNNLGGYLYYLGKPLEGIEEQPLFKEVEEVVDHFRNVVIPDYIKSNGNFYSIKYFKEENSVYEFCRSYLTTNKINWGQTIDVIEVLEKQGYFMPKHSDKGFNVDEYIEYTDIVTDISREMVKHLKMFGFGADRNTNNLVGHDIKEKHKKCMNLIFTRYPWSSAYKIIKTVKGFLSISGKNFFSGQDLEKFEKEDPSTYEFVRTVIETFKDTHIGTSKTVLDVGFEKANMDFIEHMDLNADKLHTKYKKKRPKGYGKYK
jgi:hypothetical protein